MGDQILEGGQIWQNVRGVVRFGKMSEGWSDLAKCQRGGQIWQNVRVVVRFGWCKT